jgi:putative 4-mercaptohistidine N1-methyltranferase
MALGTPYETDALLREYLLFHFGDEAATFGKIPGPVGALGFAQRCVTRLLGPVPDDAAALDVGCAVGGSAFELAKTCRAVHGVDFSKGFVAAARRLAAEGMMESAVLVEAGRMVPFLARVDPSVDRRRVTFEAGDAMALDPALGAFDVVLAANLICRLPAPMKFLDRLPELVKPGGQLLLATPFTWLEDYTPPALWLGRVRPGIEDLQEILEPAFTLEERVDLPFIIREHARKFQYGVSLGTRWRRRPSSGEPVK